MVSVWYPGKVSKRRRCLRTKGIIMSDLASIVLRRRTAAIVAPGESTVTPETIHAISDFENRLERLGYTLSGDAITALTTVKPDRIKVIASATVEAAAVLVGSTDRNGNAAPVAPMYPNFPRQVQEASDAELYLNALLHYFGDAIGARIMPVYEKLDRRGGAKRTRALREVTHVESIDRVTNDIHASLVGQKAAWSELDREDVSFIIRRANTFNQTLVFPTFGSKANLAWYATLTDDPRIVSYATSLTDVLRIAVAVAGGNPEFVKPSAGGEKLGNVPRPFRRALVRRIDELADTDGDFRRRLGLWKTVGKLLHVSEYAASAPKAVELFARLRANDIPVSDRGLIQTGQVTGAEADALRAKSPGEFARDLDWALRTSSDPEATLDAFEKVADAASARTLWGAYGALENRGRTRIFVPKGQASKAIVSREPLPELDMKVHGSAIGVITQALVRRAEKNSPIPEGSSVYIAPELYDFAVPFSLRQQGVATRVVGRGSRVKLAEGENIRFFMWWKDIADGYDGRVDLDMSLSFMNKDFEVTSEVAYYNLRNGAATHSGDITSAPNGAAEYIDISSESLARERGARYVLMSVNSYTHQHFKDIPEAIAGVMLRDDLEQGEVFDGKTVETAFSLAQDAPVAMPFLYDIQTRELYWLDYSGSRPRGRVNAAANHRATFSDIARAAVERRPVSIGDVIDVHVHGRAGDIVETPEEADIVFDASVAFQAEKFLAEWL